MINGRADGKPEVGLKRKAEVDARWKEFWHDHKDFEPGWARFILNSLSEFLTFVFDFDAVRHGMEELYVKSGVKCPSDWDWDSEWTGAHHELPSTTVRQLRIHSLALALRAYAYYGLKLRVEDPNPANPDELHFDVLDDFLIGDWLQEGGPCLFPREWIPKEMEETITAAVARHKLDFPQNDEEGITPDELAALAGVSRKSIMNLLAPSNRSLLAIEKEGRVTIGIESARRWLQTRPNFKSSVWRYQDEEIDEPVSSSERPSVADPIFVPVGSDEVWFSPAHLTPLKRNPKRDEARSVYYVANGDQEERHEDYWAALNFLNTANSPRWRYLDAGQMCVKHASGWIRKSRQEIERLVVEENQNA